MSSSGSFDSLLCSSSSDNKNFSPPSVDEASAFTSSNSLNTMAAGDLPSDERETCKMDEQEIQNPTNAEMDATCSRRMEVASDSLVDSSASLVEAKDKVDAGGMCEQHMEAESSASAGDGGKIEFKASSKIRKRLRERLDDDDDYEAADGDDRDKAARGDEPTESLSTFAAAPQGEEENSRDVPTEPSGSTPLHSASTSSPPSDSDSDDHGDDNEDNFEDLYLQEDLFIPRRLGHRRKVRKNDDAERQKASTEDLPTKFHYKLLGLLRRREIGFAPRVLNGYKSYQDAVVADIDVVKKFGLLHRYEKHAGCVNCLHFNDAGNLLASGSDDMKVVVYDWIKEKVHISFASSHKENIFQTKFMPHSGDSHIVTCARDGAVRIAQLSTTGSCRSHNRLATHKGAAHKLALIQDSPHEFYSCGEDGLTHQIDLRIGKPCMSFVTKNKNRRVVLYSIHANPMANHEICVVGRDPFVRIFDVRNINKSKEEMFVKKFYPDDPRSESGHITAAVYNYNGTEILASYNDDDIYLFDAAHSGGAGHLKKYEGHKNTATVKGVNFYGPKSEYVVSGSDCGNVFIWDKKRQELVNLFHGDEGGVVNVIENHPTLPMIATSGLDSDVKIWCPDKTPASNLDKYRLVHRFYNEFDDNRLLWFLMRTLTRNRGNAGSSSGSSSNFAMVTEDDEDNNNHDDDDNNHDDDNDDTDDGNTDGAEEGQGRQNIQCAPS